MKLERFLVTLLLIIALPMMGFADADSNSDSEALGRIAFPTSGSATAQEAFLRGVLWLHSFEYGDARQAFQQAQSAEPGFAMAYWGEAMTYNHPIWLQENLSAARSALERLAPTPEERLAKTPTERERDYLRSVEILFGDGEKRHRDQAYAEAMERLMQAYPDDLEAASFYALALLGTCHDGRDFATYMKAAAVVEEVFDRNPEHPGAAHYLIHAYDDSTHAPLGLRPARIYAKIAPAAAHALHMPSHIFLALGMWDEAAASNEDSWRAAFDKVEREGLASDHRNYHALLWLEYTYLQQGRYRDAEQLLQTLVEDHRQSGSERTGRHLAYMRGHYLVETERWDRSLERPKLGDASLTPAATDLFAAGFSAIYSGDLEAAEKALNSMRERREKTLAQAEQAGSSGGYTQVGAPRTAEAQAMESQLAGMLHLVRGQTEEGLTALEHAVALEDTAPFGYGPPIPVKPSHELYGEVLISLDRFEDAQRQFEASLARAPRRARSLLGLARAAAKLGDAETVKQTHMTLRAIWHRADDDLPELTEIGVLPAADSAKTAGEP